MRGSPGGLMQPSRVVAVLMLIMLLAFGPAAGVAAQSDEALVALIDVESQAFPQVTTSVAVSDASGPLEGLTAADFRVVEEGNEVPADAITVESDTSQELRLALVLDVSMRSDLLSQVKQAAKGFVDSLGSPDKVALISFYEQVQVVQDFTNNKEVLKTAIDGLTAQGNYSALNQAAFEAVTRASTLATGRKAVILLTNSDNNIGGRSADEVINQARTAHVAVYTISFDKATPNGLKPLAAGTGGRDFFLSDLAAVSGSFQAIGKLLRQGGYRVAFRSHLKADGKEHALVIGVRKKGLGEGRFVAVPGQVTVSLPGLVDGQQVAGVVTLAAQATAPAPIASVTYLLNDRLLGEVTTPPYSLEWDSTSMDAGTYRLVARAVDQVGNAGEAALNIKLPQSLAVTASASQSRVTAGTPLTVTATVEAFGDVERVDFLLDGQLMGSDSTSPYVYAFNSKSSPVGEHLVTVRAYSKGRMAQARLDVQFLAPPVAPFPWSKVLMVAGVILAALVLVVLAALVLSALVRAQKRPKVFQLEVVNLGNTHSRYRLRAEEPMGALRFDFALNGVKLPQWSEPQAVEAVTGPVAEASFAPAPVVAAPAQSKGNGGSVGARSAAGQAIDKGDAAVDSAWSLANMLPGSMGTSAQRALNPAYQAQSTVRSTRSQAQRVSSEASYVSQVAGAKPASAPAGSTDDTIPPGQMPAPAARGRPSGKAPTAKAKVKSRAVSVAVPALTWFETPLLGPGGKLLLDLLISPLNYYRTQRYAFKVISRAAEQEDTSLVEQGYVQIDKIPWLYRLLPYLVFAIFVAVVVLAAVGLLMVFSMWAR
jgi:VWFA-related protein